MAQIRGGPGEYRYLLSLLDENLGEPSAKEAACPCHQRGHWLMTPQSGEHVQRKLQMLFGMSGSHAQAQARCSLSDCGK